MAGSEGGQRGRGMRTQCGQRYAADTRSPLAGWEAGTRAVGGAQVRPGKVLHARMRWWGSNRKWGLQGLQPNVPPPLCQSWSCKRRGVCRCQPCTLNWVCTNGACLWQRGHGRLVRSSQDVPPPPCSPGQGRPRVTPAKLRTHLTACMASTRACGKPPHPRSPAFHLGSNLPGQPGQRLIK